MGYFRLGLICRRLIIGRSFSQMRRSLFEAIHENVTRCGEMYVMNVFSAEAFSQSFYLPRNPCGVD